MRKEQRQPSAVDLILARQAAREEAFRKRQLEDDKERQRRRGVAMEKDRRYGISTALREINDKLLEGKGEVTLLTPSGTGVDTKIVLLWFWGGTRDPEHAIVVVPNDTGTIVYAEARYNFITYPDVRSGSIKEISFSSRNFAKEFSEALVEAYVFSRNL